MKQLGVIALLLGTVGLATLAAQRIFTNPRPEAHFKTLVPNAGGFGPFGGTPLHYKVYGADPKANPGAPVVGVIFWTTDMVPKEYGYHGPIHMLVGMDMKGVLTGVVVDYNSEPYGYFSVDPPQFAAQFKGKSIRDRFVVGADVAGCVGIAGSANIGRRCTVGGGAIILGHLTLADDVNVSSGTLVAKSISSPGTYTGTVPFMSHDEWLKNFARLRHLESMADRIRALEGRLAELEKKA